MAQRKASADTLVTGDGPPYLTTIDGLFADMRDRARRSNRWVADHPVEVEKRLRAYEKIERLRTKSTILTRLDKIPQDDETLVALFSDDDSENWHIFGNKPMGVYLTLADERYNDLFEPEALLIKSGGAFNPALYVSRFPKIGTYPFDMQAAMTYFD